jgi:hypothetical protein
MNKNPKVAKKQELNMVGSFFGDEIHILCYALLFQTSIWI